MRRQLGAVPGAEPGHRRARSPRILVREKAGGPELPGRGRRGPDM